MFQNPELLIIRIPAILLALTIHEFAHGYVAFRLGDRTAYDAGRVSLNPIVHLDPIGTIPLFFHFFGWAKPVPVDPRFFKDPQKGIFLVSLAGPLSNIILALLIGYLSRFMEFSLPFLYTGYLKVFLLLAVYMNIGISFFNLLPFPPLDGSKILLGLIPEDWVPAYVKYSRYMAPIFIFSIIADYLWHIGIFSRIINPFYLPYRDFILSLINIGA